MDTDWCLTCDRHFQGTGPYCSLDCKDRAGPCTYVHDSQWQGSSIIAWASHIPPCTSVSSGASTPTSLRSSSTSLASSPNTSSSFLPPKLLRSNHRPLPPTLCMTTPRPSPSPPSCPISTPQQHTTAALSMSRFGDSHSMGKTSVLSAPTESSLATPASTQSFPFSPSKDIGERPSIFGAIATHVRSWVSPATPLLSSPPKQRISAPLPNRVSDARKFTVLAHNDPSHSPPTDIAFSSPSPADETAPVWHLSSTILVDKPSKTNPKMARDIRSNQLPYKSRGRKLSRAVA